MVTIDLKEVCAMKIWYQMGNAVVFVAVLFVVTFCDNGAANIVFPPDGDNMAEPDGDVDILEVEENGDGDIKPDGDGEDGEPEADDIENDAIDQETDVSEDSEVDIEDLEEDIIPVCDDASSPFARRSDLHPGTWQPLYPPFAPHLPMTDGASSPLSPRPDHAMILANSRLFLGEGGVPELVIGHDRLRWSGAYWSRSTKPWQLLSVPAQASGGTCGTGTDAQFFDFARRYYQPAGRGFDPWFLTAGLFDGRYIAEVVTSTPIALDGFINLYILNDQGHWINHVPVAADGSFYPVTDSIRVTDGDLDMITGVQQVFVPDNQRACYPALWDITEAVDYSPRDIAYQEYPSTPEDSGNVFLTSFRYRGELYAGTYYGQLARLDTDNQSWQWVYDIDCDTGQEDDPDFEMLRYNVQFDDGGILACAVCGKCITMNMDNDAIGEVDISGDFQDIIAMTKGVDNDAWLVQARYYVTEFPLKLRTVHYLQSGEVEIFDPPSDPGTDICDAFDNPSVPLVCDSNTWEVLRVDMDARQQPVAVLRANPLGGEYVLAAYRNCTWEYEVLPTPVLTDAQPGELDWYRDMLFWDGGDTIAVATINGWMIRGDYTGGPVTRNAGSGGSDAVLYRLESGSGDVWTQAAYGSVEDMAEDVDGSLVMLMKGGLTGPTGCGVLRVSPDVLTEIGFDQTHCGGFGDAEYHALYETPAGVYVTMRTAINGTYRFELYRVGADSLSRVTVENFPEDKIFNPTSLTGDGNGNLLLIAGEGYATSDSPVHFVWHSRTGDGKLFDRMQQQGYSAVVNGGVLLPGGGMYMWNTYRGDFFVDMDGDWLWEASLGGPMTVSMVKNRLFAIQEGNIDERVLPRAEDMRDMAQCNKGYFPLTDSRPVNNGCDFYNTSPPTFDSCEGDTCPVPAGDYCLNSYPEAVKVTLGAFAMDKYEVGNGQYAQCVAAGMCTAPATATSFPWESYYGNPAYDTYPVTNVSLAQAADYCGWKGGRLPTTFEWLAAAGAQWGIKYPWGNTPPHKDDTALVNVAHNTGHPVAVDACPDGASPFGVMQMMGNVAEWTMSVYPDDYLGCREGCDNPRHSDIDENAWYSLMGGAFAGPYVFGDELQRVISDINAPEAYSATYGFRCVFDSLD